MPKTRHTITREQVCMKHTSNIALSVGNGSSKHLELVTTVTALTIHSMFEVTDHAIVKYYGNDVSKAIEIYNSLN